MSKKEQPREYTSIDFDGDIAGRGVIYDPNGCQIPETMHARPANRRRVLPLAIKQPDENDPFKT
jgi:hypothetical protein